MQEDHRLTGSNIPPEYNQGFIVVTPEWIEHLETSGIAQSIRDNVARQCAGTEELMSTLKEAGVDIICTTSTAPVQFEGELDGLYFYFRARGEYWSCTIAPTLDDAVSEENVAYSKSDSYGEEQFAASWMPHKEALQLILGCVQEFRGGVKP